MPLLDSTSYSERQKVQNTTTLLIDLDDASAPFFSGPLGRRSLQPADRKHQTPRFPVSSPATDAGPGAYISSEFAGRGPAYSIPSRSPRTLDTPDSPGPGQYVHVQLSVGRGENSVEEGFGKRDSPRFATGKDMSRAALWVCTRINVCLCVTLGFYATLKGFVMEQLFSTSYLIVHPQGIFWEAQQARSQPPKKTRNVRTYLGAVW